MILTEKGDVSYENIIFFRKGRRAGNKNFNEVK